MNTPAQNGGFPEPPAGEPQRLVRVRHSGCGAQTRVRLPRVVPARAVRRVVCESCDAEYECDAVEEVWPPSRGWRWASTAVAAVVVAGALWLVQGGRSDQPAAPGAHPAAPVAAGADEELAPAARFVVQPGFSVALPPGWRQAGPKDGTAFAARSLDGGAQATLWIQRDPSLGFEQFERRTTAQLRSLGGEVEVVERIQAPTADGKVVRLRTDAPPESGVSAPYEVTLRASGPYRYYLATTVLPGASEHAAGGAELVHTSFVPRADGGGKVKTGSTPAGAAP